MTDKTPENFKEKCVRSFDVTPRHAALLRVI